MVIYAKMLDRGTFGMPIPGSKDVVTSSIKWEDPSPSTILSSTTKSAGGEPEELRKDCGADHRSLFGFNHGDGELWAEGEQVLSEQALGQRPIIGQLMQCFKSAVHPHCRRNGAVPDAVAGLGIVGAYSARKGTGLEAIEVDGTRYHKEESAQGHRDRLKDSVLNDIGLPLLRLSTAGSGEKEKIEQAISHTR